MRASLVNASTARRPYASRLFEPAGGASTAAAAAGASASLRTSAGRRRLFIERANAVHRARQLADASGFETRPSINYRRAVGYGRDFRFRPAGAGRRRATSGSLVVSRVSTSRVAPTSTAFTTTRSRWASLACRGGLNAGEALARDPASYAAGVCNSPRGTSRRRTLRYDERPVRGRHARCRRSCTRETSNLEPRPTRAVLAQSVQNAAVGVRPSSASLTTTTSRGRTTCWSTATSTRRRPYRSRRPSERTGFACASSSTSSRRSSPASASRRASTLTSAGGARGVGAVGAAGCGLAARATRTSWSPLHLGAGEPRATTASGRRRGCVQPCTLLPRRRFVFEGVDKDKSHPRCSSCLSTTMFGGRREVQTHPGRNPHGAEARPPLVREVRGRGGPTGARVGRGLGAEHCSSRTSHRTRERRAPRASSRRGTARPRTHPPSDAYVSGR